MFHALRAIKCLLSSGVTDAFENRASLDRRVRAQQFRKQGRLIETAFAFPSRMQWNRDNNIKLPSPQSIILECSEKPACYEMPQMNLASVFEIEDDAAHHSAAA